MNLSDFQKDSTYDARSFMKVGLLALTITAARLASMKKLMLDEIYRKERRGYDSVSGKVGGHVLLA